MPFFAENYSSFEKQLLACCWVLVEAEFLTTKHCQVTMSPELPIMNWMLPDSSSHKATLGSAGSEVLVPKRGMPPPKNTAEVPLSWKLRLPHWAFGLLMLMNQEPPL